jgi:lycopene cyclase domain-containing protein
MVLPAIFYIVWDNWFTASNVWSFNPEYILEIFVYKLPLEEVLFFFVVPYCCLFIYACIRSYFPEMRCTRSADYALGILALALLIAAIIFRDRLYTSVTFVLNAFFIGVLLSCRSYFKDFHTNAFLISYAIVLIPFLIVNGFLTSIPVVLYNDAENLGLRIYTIPMEDVFYGMLLFGMNVAIYERISRVQVLRKNAK